METFWATQGCPWIWLLNASQCRSLALRFNGHFPGEPGLAGVYWSKGWWWGGEWWQLDYRSYKLHKAPVKSSPPTNQHPVFLQAGCPSCRPTKCQSTVVVIKTMWTAKKLCDRLIVILNQLKPYKVSIEIPSTLIMNTMEQLQIIVNMSNYS